ncbi:hypothetical protein RB595_007490 [Gaeumannomyces hyphopodioides]
MHQGGNPGRSQDRNSRGKTIKERLSNITTAFQADRKRRKPPRTASPITTTTAAAAAAAAASISGRGSSHDRGHRAGPALKSPALQHFVPTHTPDRPSRPVRDAPSEEDCYSLFSGGKQQQQQQYQQQQGAATAATTTTPSFSLPTTRHGSFASGGGGSSGHGSGVLVVHLDSPPPPLFEQPRPAPMPWLASSGGGPPGSEGWRHHRQQQSYRSSPSPMRQQSAASSRSGSTHRHRGKELPPLRIGDHVTARTWRGEERLRGPRRGWREEDHDGCDGAMAGRGDGSATSRQLRGEFSPSPSPSLSPHGRPRETAAAACRLCRRHACEPSGGLRNAALCRRCELAPTLAAGPCSGGSVISSVSSGSHYGDDESPAGQRRRPQESGPPDMGGSDYSSRVGSVSSDSRAGSPPLPLEVARGVALTAAPCSPREVDVVGSPASARSDADAHRHPHHTFDFGFSTAAAAAAVEGQGGDCGDGNVRGHGAGGGAAAEPAATRQQRRLVVVEQRPVVVTDGGGGGGDEGLDWDKQWSPAYYFGEPGAGEAGSRLGKAVRRQIEADNERGSGGSHDSLGPEPTPTSPILSRLPSEDKAIRAAVAAVARRREEPTSFI